MPVSTSPAPVLVVVDIQGGDTVIAPTDGAIPLMGGKETRAPRVKNLIARFRQAGLPVIFIQEVHKPSMVDIGRELDGAEGPHCAEDDPTTALASWIDPQPEEFVIRKRRYSAFFGTELEIILKAYKAQTLFLVGGLTDVCIHYTAVDAHQHDYFVRVVTDGVGGSSQRAHDASLEAIEYLQRDALVTSDEVVAWIDSLQS